MINLIFTLSMPGVNSWNGKWSGSDNFYLVHRKFQNRSRPDLESILSQKSFRHSFGDGWVAQVDVTETSEAEAKKLAKKSSGFCGYEWMIDSIIRNGDIRI
jgi:hypothetical protein